MFNNQDLPTTTAIQKGQHSCSAPRGRYSWEEAVLSQFNRCLVRRYRAVSGACHEVRLDGSGTAALWSDKQASAGWT